MNILRKIFPLSYGATDVKDLVVKIIIYVAMALGAGLVLWVAGWAIGWIPVLGSMIGVALKLIGWSVEVYLTGGIVVAILNHTKVLQ